MPVSRAQAQTPWFIKNVMNPLFTLTGAFPIIAVRGRRTGKVYRTPINLLEVDGVRYLLSPRGETGAVGEVSVKQKGTERRYRAVEVPVEERPKLIAAYLEKWGNQTRGQFAKLPDPADHPTFRLEAL
jgi:hypothetical protein